MTEKKDYEKLVEALKRNMDKFKNKKVEERSYKFLKNIPITINNFFIE